VADEARTLGHADVTRHFRFALVALLGFTLLVWVAAGICGYLAAQYPGLDHVADRLLDGAQISLGAIFGVVGTKVFG
jgi:hypothetical protein